MKRKYTAAGSGTLLLALIVWFFVVAVMVALVTIALSGQGIGIYGMYALLGGSELLLIVPLVVYMGIMKISPKALMGNRTNVRQNLFAALFGVLLVPGLMGLEALISALFAGIGIKSTDTSFMDPKSLGAMFVGFLAIGVTAGAVEEPIFRGVALRGLGSAWGRRAAIVLSALAFSLFHLDAVGTIERFLIGLFLGCMAWRAGAMLPGMLAHATFNSTAVALTFLLGQALNDWNGFFPRLSADMNGVLSLLLISVPFAAAAWGAYWLFARATPATAAWSEKPYAASDTKAAGIVLWVLVLVVLLALTVIFALIPMNDISGKLPGFSG